MRTACEPNLSQIRSHAKKSVCVRNMSFRMRDLIFRIRRACETHVNGKYFRMWKSLVMSEICHFACETSYSAPDAHARHMWMTNIFACENRGSCAKYPCSHAKTLMFACEIIVRSHAPSHTNSFQTNLNVRMRTACERLYSHVNKNRLHVKKLSLLMDGDQDTDLPWSNVILL